MQLLPKLDERTVAGLKKCYEGEAAIKAAKAKVHEPSWRDEDMNMG